MNRPTICVMAAVSMLAGCSGPDVEPATPGTPDMTCACDDSDPCTKDHCDSNGACFHETDANCFKGSWVTR